MILRPKSPLRHPRPHLGGATATAAALVPTWLRRAVPDARSLAEKDVGDVALVAGAAIGALDAVVRRRELWAGVWRQRLALAAAAVTAKRAGRVEDEAALRDALLLTKPGDEVGPAGRMLLAWRRLAGMPAEKLLTDTSIGVVLEDLGLACDDDRASNLADDLRQVATSDGTAGVLTGAFAAAERYGLGRTVGSWFADAMLAERLGWVYAVPLLGAQEVVAGIGADRPRRSGTTIAVADVGGDADRAKVLLGAQARAALRAVDLSAELERRSERLLAVAPKLRARASDLVVEKLLSDDALVATEQIAGMTDRGMRRLFDRLVEFGAVRELSGRPAFRVYGL
jgi:hypothetical protein